MTKENNLHKIIKKDKAQKDLYSRGEKNMKEIRFGKGEVLFREGTWGNDFYQIIKGTAGAYLNYGEEGQKKLSEMTEGQYFGEMAVIEAWPRSSTIVAESELVVNEIPGKDFFSYFREKPETILTMMKQIGERIRNLTAEYDEVCQFIREKQEPEAKKKEGFLAKLKKYRAISAMAKKNSGATAEDLLVQKTVSSGIVSLPVTLYNRGQIIFREGDEGVYMYAVHGGAVDIFTGYGTPNENKLATLYSDSFFGEMAIVGKEVRSATAVVAENNTILEAIREVDLGALFESNPPEVEMILAHLCNRLRKLTVSYFKACEQAAEEA